jgi:hypothetical protein
LSPIRFISDRSGQYGAACVREVLFPIEDKQALDIFDFVFCKKALPKTFHLDRSSVLIFNQA